MILLTNLELKFGSSSRPEPVFCYANLLDTSNAHFIEVAIVTL